MLEHKLTRIVSAVSFVLASLLAVGSVPAANAAEKPGTPTPPTAVRMDTKAIPAAKFSVAQATARGPLTFSDVKPGTPLYTEIMWMASAGVMKGNANRTFAPAASTSRMEMAIWAYRVAGSPAYTAPTVSPFKDVAKTAAGYKEISWAVTKGIIPGYADKTFRPTPALSRESLAVALYSLAGKSAYVAPAVSPFKDISVRYGAYKAIAWTVSQGFAGAYSDRTYRYTAPVRHDSIAQVYYKFLHRLQPVTAAAGTPNVGPLGVGHASALVRLTVASSRVESTIMVGGAPALMLRAGMSGSTTVLAPLKGNAIPLTASTPRSVRVEVLATFDGTATTPGSTIALPPVTRADTAKKLAGDQISTTPIQIGLTGDGGVPATDVRAVYATVTVQVSTARTLTIGGQKLPVPAGKSSLTTILVPKEDGSVDATLDAGAGHLRLDVRGYIPESSQNANSVNVGGSFVRLLTSLAAKELLDHDARTGNWVLGPEILLMGSVASARFPLEDIARPSLRRLAEETGECAFFSVRRGAETVCLLREEGSFPVRSFVLHEGVRFPLGVASAGTAILAFLPESEQEQVLSEWPAHAGKFAEGHPEAVVRANLQQTRQLGYSVNPGLVLEGSWGMGAAVFDQANRPAWALSLTGIEPRFRGDRQEFLGRLLLEEAHRISALLRTPSAS